MFTVLRPFICTIALCAGALSLLGQVASRIGGIVSDASGVSMTGVMVTVTDVDRGTKSNTITNDSGRYAFPNLGVGKYRVSAESPGFKSSTTDTINIDVNQAVDVNIKMEVGTVLEHV